MLQIRGPLLPERLILQKDMENILRQAVEEESDLAGIHFEGGVVPTETLRIISLKDVGSPVVDLENAKENSFTFSM